MDAVIERHVLAECCFVKAGNDGENLICFSIVNQVDCSLIIQESVLGVKPNPGFIRRIKLTQSVNDVPEVRNQ